MDDRKEFEIKVILNCDDILKINCVDFQVHDSNLYV